jgi:hypothetical protein
MARKASTPEQLQQLLAVLRTNYLHHRRAAPSVTYSSHLSCALLEVGVGAAGSGTCHDVRPAVVYTLGTAAVLLLPGGLQITSDMKIYSEHVGDPASTGSL